MSVAMCPNENAKAVLADERRRGAVRGRRQRRIIMQRSTDRILVTHVGSLVRPMSIRNILCGARPWAAIRRGCI